MNRSSRLLIPMALAGVLASALIIWISVATQREHARKRTVEDLARHAALMAGSAHLLPDDSMQAYAIRTSTALRARVTLIGRDGGVVADSAIDASLIAAMDDHIDRPEVEAASLRGSGVKLRRSSTTRVDYYYLAHRVDTPATVGFVRLAIPTSYIPLPAWHSGWPVFAAGIASMLMVALIALALQRRTSRSLDELSRSMEDVTRASQREASPARRAPAIERLSAAVKRTQAEALERIAELDTKGGILTSVIGGMKEGLLVVGSDRRIQLANRAMRDILGLPFDPTGRLIAEVVRHPTVIRDLESALEARREIRESIVTFETSGRSFELQITPMQVADDRSIRLLVLFFDVTRLQALDAVRREFVGNVSHELRTPLTSINAFVETLLEGELDDPQTSRRFLSIVQKHASRMNALLDDLTDLSAIETGSIRLEARKLDAREVVREVVEPLRPFADARKVQVTTELPEALPLYADRGRLEQVLTNLIHNAIKFNRPHGTVTVRGRREGGRIRLDVEDTGVGIPASSHDKIFNRFYQLDKARSREHGGTGLGLAIVKHLMRLHGGTVRVESELGDGATFTLEFPVHDPPLHLAPADPATA